MIALTDPDPAAQTSRLAVGLTLVGLSLLVWGITAEAHPGLGGRRVAALVLLVMATGAWVAWVRSRLRSVPSWLGPVALTVMGLAGGGLVAFAPLGLVFVAVAALGATSRWEPRRAAWIAASGPAAMLVSVPAAGRGFGLFVGGLASALAGVLMGISRRQSHEHTRQAVLVQITEARAEAERARAELLAGRNHLARELHDVLAHTLSALSLQLEALDALVGAERPSPAVRAQLDRTKRLVRDGMAEARGAVQALREDVLPLEDQLVRLAGESGAAMEVDGEPRPLPADVSLALYRVAQEALTNVVKHAPGADAAIHLEFDDGRVELTVCNGAVSGAIPSPLATSGGGYGLQGLQERLLLLDGRVEAGPVDDGPSEGGWRVRAVVPT